MKRAALILGFAVALPIAAVLIASLALTLAKLGTAIGLTLGLTHGAAKIAGGLVIMVAGGALIGALVPIGARR